ncbi:acetolactate synthase [Coprobacter tertius]|uniref:Acetolactate synthase n=1 Tax=Coprobacter tertius TaxID=2944915 RepID=A0ABT1MHJ2_9BACT|nr:acetolactate synthase [Coprobacter tertius]MCP9612085.1 acetolactate synthase [Coprobacter tertius]
MIIQQLSVFLENKSGRLNEILEMLGQVNIRIIAATVADTSEYGILRLITTDTQKACTTLREKKVSANMSEVIAISCDSRAGTFAKQLRYFSENGISIEYMYCFSIAEKAFLILKTDNVLKAKKVAIQFGLELISEKELLAL